MFHQYKGKAVSVGLTGDHKGGILNTGTASGQQLIGRILTALKSQKIVHTKFALLLWFVSPPLTRKRTEQ
jgi:hypothetical protein